MNFVYSMQGRGFKWHYLFLNRICTTNGAESTSGYLMLNKVIL